MREARGAIFNTETVMPVDRELLERLKAGARASDTGRYRLCLHHAPSEPVQQMIVVHCRANYSRPHRQDASKLFVAIEGELSLLIFDEQGNLADRIVMQPPGHDAPFCVRLSPSCWHTMFAQSEAAVFCEVMGAANPDGQATDFPPWAPPESDGQAVAAFLQQHGLTIEPTS